MKLNTKGLELYDKWEHIYYDELDKERKERNDPNWIEGWCIIDDWDHIHDINDEIGLLIFGYEDCAMGHLMEWANSPDEVYIFGFTYRQIVEMMKEYFDYDESEADEFEWDEPVEGSETNG